MNLNDQMKELIKSFNIPEEVLEKIGKAMKGLESKGIAPGLQIGEKAPGFRLSNAVGIEVSLKKRLEEGPVVLSFYRGEWCPFCNLEIKALQEYMGQIKEAGASLIAISPQVPSNAMSLTEKHALTFDVLSDASQKAIREYKLQFHVPKDIKELYTKQFNLDIALENADGSWNLPVPATFVLDSKGIVRARHVSLDYTTRMEPGEIIKALKSIS